MQAPRVALALGGAALVLAGCGAHVENGANADANPGARDGTAAADGGLADAGPHADLPPRGDADLATLYGTVWVHDDTTLYRIDPSTWNPVAVGPFSAAACPGGYFPTQMTDLAVTPDGHLYTVSFGALWSVSKTTGAATLVMSLGGIEENGLTFLPDDTLLGVDKTGAVTKIDPVAKTVKAVGSFGGGFDSSGDLVAVSDGTLYGISDTDAGGADASASNILLKVNPATGVATRVGPIGFGMVWGLAYWHYHVLAFTGDGNIIEIDPTTGAGTLLEAHPGMQFWGAGVSPLVPAIP